MGAGSDFSDIERFLKSKSGKEHLSILRRSLIGRTVSEVKFENNTQNVKTILQFENGSRFYCIQPCHGVDTIRELFGSEVARELVAVDGCV
jgi:hypothetical protein